MGLNYGTCRWANRTLPRWYCIAGCWRELPRISTIAHVSFVPILHLTIQLFETQAGKMSDRTIMAMSALMIQLDPTACLYRAIFVVAFANLSPPEASFKLWHRHRTPVRNSAEPKAVAGPLYVKLARGTLPTYFPAMCRHCCQLTPFSSGLKLTRKPLSLIHVAVVRTSCISASKPGGRDTSLDHRRSSPRNPMS